MGIIKTLASRAEKICDDKMMENKEKKRLTNIFMDNRYPRYKVQETLKKKHHRKTNQAMKRIKLYCYPTPPFEKTGVIYAVHCECGGTYIYRRNQKNF